MLTFNPGNGNRYFDSERLSEQVKKNAFVLEAVKNDTEKHGDALGWLNPEEWANDEALSAIENAVIEIRRKSDCFILIGVGGSNQAARAAISALDLPGSPEILYAGNNISAHSVRDILKLLEGKDFCINVIAKNFETLEPGIAFRVFRRELEKRYGSEAAGRVYATGTPESRLHNICREQGYHFFTFPENVGGRFTALTNVGLLPMAVAGLDIRAMAYGAKEMRRSLYEADGEQNLALVYATARKLLMDSGLCVEMLATFEPRLHFFARWWIQLFAESEGKDGKGLLPTASMYSEDLHSVGQFVQEGSPVMFETFLRVDDDAADCPTEPDSVDDGFGYLDGSSFAQINHIAQQATIDAHRERLPCLEITVPSITEHCFGAMFYFFEFACYISSLLIDVNPFDQPGVEAYKNIMFRSLGKS